MTSLSAHALDCCWAETDCLQVSKKSLRHNKIFLIPNKLFLGNTLRNLKSPSHRGSHRFLCSIFVQVSSSSVLQQLLLPHPPEVWLSSPKHMEDGVGSPAVSVISIDNLLLSHRVYVTSLSRCLRSSLDLFQLVSQTPGCSIPPIPVILTYVLCCGLWCCFGIFFLNMFLHTFLNMKSVSCPQLSSFLSKLPIFSSLPPMLLFVTVHHKEFSNHLVRWSFI